MKRIAQLYKRPRGEYNLNANNKMRKYQYAQNVYMFRRLLWLTLAHFFVAANHTVEKLKR